MTIQNPELAEHLLVLRAQLGDREALHRLFERYNPRLLYYLRRRLEAKDEADDLLQDVWVTVVRKLATLEQPRAFKAWLYRIAHNRAVSKLRGPQRSVPLEQLPPELEIDSSTPVEDEAAAFAGYDAAAINQGLERLSPAHREALTLRFVDELSYDDIAQVLGSSIGTVRSRLHYAKRSLHSHLTSTPTAS